MVDVRDARNPRGELQLVTPGDFVRCAVTGEPIALADLRSFRLSTILISHHSRRS